MSSNSAPRHSAVYMTPASPSVEPLAASIHQHSHLQKESEPFSSTHRSQFPKVKSRTSPTALPSFKGLLDVPVSIVGQDDYHQSDTETMPCVNEASQEFTYPDKHVHSSPWNPLQLLRDQSDAAYQDVINSVVRAEVSATLAES